jgi:hypothetical protein
MWEAEDDIADAAIDARFLSLTADYVTGGSENPQNLVISVEKVEQMNYAVVISGPVTIEPPLPDCNLAAVNQMDRYGIGVSWKCGETFFNQEFVGLNLWPEKDRVGWVNSLIAIRVVPTGISQQ